MTNTLKIAAAGALAALSLASAASAQPASTQNMSAQQHQQMMSGGMKSDKAMSMTADPQMPQQMMQMMKDCAQMMKQMGSMTGGDSAPKS